MKKITAVALAVLLSPCAAAGQGHAVVSRVADELERHYVDAETGRRLAAALRSRLGSGAYPASTAGEELARRVTADLRAASGDGHLGLEYSAAPIPEEDRAAAEELDRRDRIRYYGPQLNFGFQRVELLPGNIGYLDLRVFAPLDWGGETATAAMTLLANSDALVIDLRQNGGGHGEMAQWIASYLLAAEPRPLSGEYSRASGATTQRWSLPYVPGKRYGAEKPVYVLTSRRTFSAAEALAYDLQALKRATVVGERTGGGAHPYENVKLDAHFVLWLPKARSVNPLTGGNWQGVGVRPDIEVTSDDALATALAAARARLGLSGPK